jgi:formylglycine-generating enzyme required for sulfatase activity
MAPYKAIFGGWLLLVGCRTATQVTVELTTEVACDEMPSTEVQVGKLGSDIETRPASVATSACRAPGRIGSFVIVPSGDASGEFAVKVVLAHGRTVESCTVAQGTPGAFAGCIVARRALRFIPHTELTLPIELRQDCDGIVCDPKKTCVRGACVDAVVPDPGSCAGAGCRDDVLPRPTPSGGQEGGTDGAPDGSDAANEAAGNPCADAACPTAPSCAAQLLCGTESDSCCASRLLPEGTFLLENEGPQPRTISALRLDRYEVTVGRFRTFVSAVVAGWNPSPGSGKHRHLTDGGLRNKFNDQIEAGWDPAWNTFLPTVKNVWDDIDHLACVGATWTSGPGENERKPINCVTWHQSYAFCIWDGGFLPSFIERNYAATGGTAQRVYPWGNESPDTSRAQYCPDVCNSPYRPLLDVGSKPTGDGLFGHADLAGNVWEWVMDSYAGQAVCKDCVYLDPAFPTRLNLGGGVDSQAPTLAASFESQDAVAYRAVEDGFRCARPP